MEIRKLNSLRALAALIVFVTHFSNATQWLDGLLGGSAGQYGVMLFFLLSGFLMAYLYFEKGFSAQNIRSYLLARAGRIFPLYLTVVLCSYLLTQWQLEWLYEIESGGELLSHLLFVYGESVLWTISPEIQFYGLFLLFWALARRRPGFIYLLVVGSLILIFLVNFPRIHGDWNGLQYNLFNVIRSLPYFFIGLLMGMNYKRLTMPRYMKSHWFVATLVLIPLLYPDLSPVTSDAKTRMWLSYEVLLIMSSVFFSIVFLVPDNNVLLSNKVGDFLGKISFSLYLLHLPVISQVAQLSLSVEIKLLLSLCLSIAVATISYYCLEQSAAKLIRSRFMKGI